MSTLDYQFSYKRQLPHIQPPGAILFVTFRLAGSLPATAFQRLREEADQIEADLAAIEDEAERARRAYREQRRLFGIWDSLLDTAATGPQWLNDQRVAQVVSDSLHFRDEEVYNLDCFCIMPNHVHTVFTPLPTENGRYHSLPGIMHSLKRYSAILANDILGREGQFWQHESYDHIVRDAAELGRIRRYVCNNPLQAALTDDPDAWPWTYRSWLR